MMSAAITLLLGLLAILFVYGEDTGGSGEQFSWDSSDEETPSGVSYSGVIVQVYKADGEGPSVTLGTDKDNHERIYCFNFLRTFEALNYNITTSQDARYEEITDSAVDLAKANCTATETSTTQFIISCDAINGGTLSLVFKFMMNIDGNHGLEYSINFEDYTFESTDSNAQLVLVQSLKECQDKHPYSADSDSDSDDSNEDTTTTTSDPVTRRRRLLSDDDSEDGISSDDSDEFDAGFIQFVVDGQAYDKCDGVDDKSINSGLVYQSSIKELHIVFNHFQCDLSLDPNLMIDDSKTQESGTCHHHIIIAIIMSFVVALLF